ncbi:ankyrin repeat and SOCS box protein 10 isoform 1-T1 [Geothlypis trichas]
MRGCSVEHTMQSGMSPAQAGTVVAELRAGADHAAAHHGGPRLHGVPAAAAAARRRRGPGAGGQDGPARGLRGRQRGLRAAAAPRRGRPRGRLGAGPPAPAPLQELRLHRVCPAAAAARCQCEQSDGGGAGHSAACGIAARPGRARPAASAPRGSAGREEQGGANAAECCLCPAAPAPGHGPLLPGVPAAGGERCQRQRRGPGPAAPAAPGLQECQRSNRGVTAGPGCQCQCHELRRQHGPAQHPAGGCLQAGAPPGARGASAAQPRRRARLAGLPPQGAAVLPQLPARHRGPGEQLQPRARLRGLAGSSSSRGGAEIPVFLPVPFLPGAHTSLPAAPGSLRAQEPPGGPAAAGAVPAAPAQCPAPVPAARLRGRSLLGAAVPVLLCLSVQMFHPASAVCALQLPPSPHPILPGHISPLCRACCCVPVPASPVLCIMHLFWSVLFVQTNPDRLQTNKRRYGN